MGRAIFDLLQNRVSIDTPQPITKKFVTDDYVGDLYSLAKLGAYPSTGGLLGTWVKYKQNYFYFFGNSPTDQTSPSTDFHA